jgi:hypothetical protein
MVCAVCRMEYLTVHNCPGLAPASEEEGTAPPSGFALFYYLKEAWRIIRWDDSAIRRTAADSRVLPYGLLVWASTNLFVYAAAILEMSGRVHQFAMSRLILGAALTLPIAACIGLVHIGVCHLFARWFFAGEGHFVGLLRPLLLATMVYVLAPIPLFGMLLGGIAWIAVVMMVFQEVHGMEPLTAFLLSAGVGIAIRIVEYMLTGHIF